MSVSLRSCGASPEIDPPRSLSDIDRPPLAENLQMGYQLFYPTHAMEAP